MNEPEVLIFVEGGVVQWVGSSQARLIYRLIDVDNDDYNEPILIDNLIAEQMNIELKTEEIKKEYKK